jgi:hypothetical protein
LFKQVVQWVVDKNVAIPVSGLVDAIRQAQTNLEVQSAKADNETLTKYRAMGEEMEAMVHQLESTDFPTRLRRWTGDWSREDNTNIAEEGQPPVYRSEKEIRALASQVVTNPELLTTDLQNWLCSAEAKKAYRFFWWLGKLDSDQSLLPALEKLAKLDEGAAAFGSYCGGQAQNGRNLTTRLDWLTSSREITPESVIRATQNLGLDAAGVRRLVSLIEQRQIDRSVIARALNQFSLADQSDLSTVLPLLRSAAGPALEHAADVIDFLAFRLQAGNRIKGEVAELAWQCLETCPPVNTGQAFECDQLAASLAERDPKRALKLLEKLLTQRREQNCWEPLERHGSAEFWNRLQASHGDQALLTVLTCAMGDPLVRFRVAWCLSDVISQEANRDVLLQFAMQGEREAVFVAEAINGAYPGFWPIAIKIVEKYPHSERIRGTLDSDAEHIGNVITGSSADHLEKCRKEVEAVLGDATLSPVARDWLRELESSLRASRDRERASEIDEEINGMVRIAENREAQERLWAIATLLRRDKLRDLLNVMSKAELESLVPSLGLTEEEAAEVNKKMQGL